MILLFSFIYSQEYADFDIITNNNPYPGNIFIHTQSSNYMAILDGSLAPYWYVKSDNIGGIDFKESNGFRVNIGEYGIEWFLPIESIPNDSYIFDETSLTLQSRRKKQVLKVGQRLEILLLNADSINRSLEFRVENLAIWRR